MYEIKLDPLPIVTGDPDELLDLDIIRHFKIILHKSVLSTS